MEAEEPRNLGREDVTAAVGPLRMIFWGGLLCIFDITFSETRNGSGWKFDILNDALGVALIAFGVFRLARAPVHDRYNITMALVKVVAVLSLLQAIAEHWVFDTPELYQFGVMVLGLFEMAAVLAFCVCMRWFCLEARLEEAARSWLTTTVLFAVLVALPVAGFYAAACFAMLTGQSFHIDLGPAGLLLLFVFAIPVIHLFVSTSRMSRAASGN